MATLIDHEGQLVVQDDWEMRHDEPVRVASLWPTGLRASRYPHLVGVGVRYCEGVYSSGAVRIPLPEGGATRPVGLLQETVKPPAGGPWRYANGEWVNTRTGKRRQAV